jgi:hypothetical protein
VVVVVEEVAEGEGAEVELIKACPAYAIFDSQPSQTQHILVEQKSTRSDNSLYMQDEDGERARETRKASRIRFLAECLFENLCFISVGSERVLQLIKHASQHANLVVRRNAPALGVL